LPFGLDEELRGSPFGGTVVPARKENTKMKISFKSADGVRDVPSCALGGANIFGTKSQKGLHTLGGNSSWDQIMESQIGWELERMQPLRG
jgi:hypothetical protein